MRPTSPLEGYLYTRSLLILVCYAFFGTGTYAQAQKNSDVCPSNTKLICTLPEVFGPPGFLQGIGPLVKVDGHAGGHFESSFITSLGPLNASVGSQLTLLPLGSPGSGLVYVYDPALKTFTASTEDLGPILTERANTTGRHKVRLGITYQRFSFGTLDGASLHNLPASFIHIDDPGPMGVPDSTGGVQVPAGQNCTYHPTMPGDTNTGLCGFVRDRIDTVTNINLRLNQVTASATFGLTSRIDVSLAIPINNIQMDISSDATIVDNSHSGNHQFKAIGCPLAPGSAVPATSPCAHEVFSKSNNATGIGDIVLRAKGVVWGGERAAVALGADLRVPTGDELNFQGSGTIGFTPFVVFSYAARVSPHVNVGYEVNGNSVLGGNITPPVCAGSPPICSTPSVFTKGHLPNQFLYSGGADVVLVKKRLAGTFDLIGQRVFNSQRATVTTQSFLGPCGPAGLAPLDSNNSNGYCNSPDPTLNVSHAKLTPTKGSFNITSASLGAKVRITDKFVIFGNALINLDDGGLRSRVVPLVGASFGF
jgi:Putative MetA-pathway of phenol degradation